MPFVLVLCSQLLAPLSVPFVSEQQTVTAAVLGSSLAKASMVQSAQGFDTRVLNKELSRGVMEVDSMSPYQYNTNQAQHTLMSTHSNTLRSASFRQNVHNVYEEMALPDGYLHGYFSQVGNQTHLIHM